MGSATYGTAEGDRHPLFQPRLSESGACQLPGSFAPKLPHGVPGASSCLGTHPASSHWIPSSLQYPGCFILGKGEPPPGSRSFPRDARGSAVNKQLLSDCGRPWRRPFGPDLGEDEGAPRWGEERRLPRPFLGVKERGNGPYTRARLLKTPFPLRQRVISGTESPSSEGEGAPKVPPDRPQGFGYIIRRRWVLAAEPKLPTLQGDGKPHPQGAGWDGWPGLREHPGCWQLPAGKREAAACAAFQSCAQNRGGQRQGRSPARRGTALKHGLGVWGGDLKQPPRGS